MAVEGAVVPEDRELRALLGQVHTIAVVGLSSKPNRPSLSVAGYLQEHGYRIVPVNPRETEVLGEPAYPTLRDIPNDITIDVVDVFRRAEETPEVARDAVAIGAKVLWLQADIVNEEAYRIASEAGLDVIMGVCIRTTRAATRARGLIRMTTWEYFVAPLLEHNPGDILNTFGEDGWELVGVAQIENPMGGKSTVAYLKRQKG